MLIASWNVNSIRARIERVTAWLAARQPDVLCMQEVKVEEKAFPFAAFEAAGYQVVVDCQKTYNGVAIAARTPISDVQRGLDDGMADEQKRMIAGTVGGVRIVNVYAPNGHVVGSDKWSYKLEWFKRLRRHLDGRYQKDTPLLLCGDFNVAPEVRDVHDPTEWEPSVLFHPEARAALADIRAFGLHDCFRLHHGQPGFYSWWDYRLLSFPKNRGLRIDHLFVTEPLVGRCSDSFIDRDARKGKQPSDHAPVLATLR